MKNNERPVIHNRVQLVDFLKETLVEKFRVDAADITEKTEYKRIEIDYDAMAKLEVAVEKRLGIKEDINKIGYIIRTKTFGETVDVLAKKLKIA